MANSVVVERDHLSLDYFMFFDHRSHVCVQCKFSCLHHTEREKKPTASCSCGVSGGMPYLLCVVSKFVAFVADAGTFWIRL